MARPAVVLTVDDVRRMLDQIRGEAMELVEQAPDQYRSEFGAGMVHGFLKAANRLGTLCDEHLQRVEQEEDNFERDFGRGDERPQSSGRFRRPAERDGFGPDYSQP